MLKLFFTLFFAPALYAAVIEKTVAVVNDQPILQSDIDKFQSRIQKGGMVDDLIITDPKSIIGDRDKIIDLLVSERLIDTEVKKQNLNATVERVEGEIRSIAQGNNISISQLRQALKEQGVDFAEYQDFIKKRIERHSLIERVITSKIKVSDEDVAAYYVSQKGDDGRDVFQYSLSHILFLPKAGDVAAAEERAKTVLDRIRQGRSFETLASQYSEDPNFTDGGFLGTFKSGEFLPEIESAVTKRQVGDITDIVKTRAGFHIVKILDRKVIPSPEFEKNKKRIREYLAEQAFRKQFSFWLAQRKQDAVIRINK